MPGTTALTENEHSEMHDDLCGGCGERTKYVRGYDVLAALYPSAENIPTGPCVEPDVPVGEELLQELEALG